MIYNAKYPRTYSWFILGISLFLIAIHFFSTNFFDTLFYFQLALCVFLFVMIMIRFTFSINNGYLTYQILFLKWTIYTKIIKPHHILKVKFRRVNWGSKGALIQVKKGLNIRIIYFVPNEVLKDLLQFADENRIEVVKTRDYLILER